MNLLHVPTFELQDEFLAGEQAWRSRRRPRTSPIRIAMTARPGRPGTAAASAAGTARPPATPTSPPSAASSWTPCSPAEESEYGAGQDYAHRGIPWNREIVKL